MPNPKTKISFGECAYCRKTRPITLDHIPPKNIFPKPRPNNLITVPACHPCNNSASDDDEYFRIFLLFTEQSYRHPATIKLVEETVMPGLNREEAERFKARIENSIRPAEIYTYSQLYLGQGYAMKVEYDRVLSVLERTIKGLIYDELEVALPDGYKIDINKLETAEQMKEIRTIFEDVGLKRLGNNIFTYKVAFTSEEDPFESYWLLSFFNAHAFLVTVD